MKFVAVFVVFVAIFAVACGTRPTPPRKCDYKCTKLEGNACGSNGICLNNFPSQCQMAKYNCLYPQKAFSQVDSWKCAEKSMPLCSIGDL